MPWGKPRKPKHDLHGRQFGWLKVLRLAGQDKQTNATWECLCLLCDTLHVVPAPSLLNGFTKSCGCLRAKKARETAAAKPRRPVEPRDSRALMLTYKRHAARQGVPFEIGYALWCELFAGACHYCGLPPLQQIRPGGMLYNGVDKMDRTRGYVEGNVVSCCKRCNMAKGKMTHDDFLSWVRSVYKHSAGPV